MSSEINPEERIVDIDLTAEMQDSFLEYSYSVIYARALPDARDGLKPVHRRIIYQMEQFMTQWCVWPSHSHCACL
jgi:DNA gyrase subunit A